MDRIFPIAVACVAMSLAGGAVAQGQSAGQGQTPPTRLPPLRILRSPSPEVLARLFPATARGMGVEGAATVSCVIRRDGTMGECAVTGENPRGLGFGGAALVAMTYYQVDVDGPNAVQVSRRLPTITIRFALPDSKP